VRGVIESLCITWVLPLSVTQEGLSVGLFKITFPSVRSVPCGFSRKRKGWCWNGNDSCDYKLPTGQITPCFSAWVDLIKSLKAIAKTMVSKKLTNCYLLLSSRHTCWFSDLRSQFLKSGLWTLSSPPYLGVESRLSLYIGRGRESSGTALLSSMFYSFRSTKIWTSVITVSSWLKPRYSRKEN